MHQFILNIGLNIKGTEPTNQLKDTLTYLKKFFGNNFSYEVVESGLSSWENERVVIVIGVSGKLFSYFICDLELLCLFLGQDAIAYKYLNVNDLVFEAFYEGEKFSFNPEYFLENVPRGTNEG